MSRELMEHGARDGHAVLVESQVATPVQSVNQLT